MSESPIFTSNLQQNSSENVPYSDNNIINEYDTSFNSVDMPSEKLPQLRENFKIHLTKLKLLADKSVDDYMWYFDKFDHLHITQQTIFDFCIRYKNSFPVRAFLLAYLRFRTLHRTFDLPETSSGRLPKRIKEIPAINEIKRMSEFLHKKKFMFGLLFDIIYQGGLRQIEAYHIKLKDFQWNEWRNDPSKLCKLKIHGKGNKDRFVLINPETVGSILDKYEDHIHDEDDLQKIFNSEAKLFKLNKKSSVYKVVALASQSISKKYSPHSLRKARATELSEKGISIQDIQLYLGHDDINTTTIYLRRDEKKALETIENTIINPEI